MSEDSAYMAPDISGWLLANSYPFNAGYAKTGVSNLTNKGYRSWEFYPYVRLYTIDHARHFALVWR